MVELVEHLLLEPLPDHLNDPAGGIVHIVAHRAGARASPALDTGEELFAVGLLRHLLPEVRVQLGFELHDLLHFVDE